MNIYFIPFLMSVIQCSVTKRKFGNNTITTVNTHTEHFLEDKINENLPLIDHDDFVQTSFSEFIPKVSKKGKYENTSQWFQGSLSNLNDNCLLVLSEEDIEKCFLDTY